MHRRPPATNNAVPVLTAIVVLAALLVPVLVAAFIILYVLPHDVGGNIFAWPVNPRMSSMMLGATYMGGAYFFLIVFLSRKWRHARLGLLPVTSFAGTLGIATLLHWQNFSHERLSFWIWAFLYFTVPLILPILWYRNEKLATRADVEREGFLSPAVRWAFGVLGAVMLIASLLLFFLPQLMIATWPWTLTPLTSRIMAAMFILPAITALSMAYDGNWSSAHFLFHAQAISIILMLIAAVIARADINWAAPTAYLFIGSLMLILLLIAVAHTTRIHPRP